MQAAPPLVLPPRSDVASHARRHRLARLGLAWLANMQVMMFAFPGYFRDGVTGADNAAVLAKAVVVMNWISLAMTVPVVAYCAWPVWRGVARTMVQRQRGAVSMDVPVALGILAAFLPSVYVTWTGQGEVYFESVTMFVAFLLTARYMQAQAGQHGLQRAPVLRAVHEALSMLSERLAFWFVVVQLALAAVVGAAWLVWQPQSALAVTVALLVMSCPCAMAMAVPTAMAAALTALRRNPALWQTDAHRALVRKTASVTRQNLIGAIAWHALMVPLAAIGLVAPWLAAVAMLVSSLAVAGNSWRLVGKPVGRPVDQPVNPAPGCGAVGAPNCAPKAA